MQGYLPRVGKSAKRASTWVWTELRGILGGPGHRKRHRHPAPLAAQLLPHGGRCGDRSRPGAGPAAAGHRVQGLDRPRGLTRILERSRRSRDRGGLGRGAGDGALSAPRGRHGRSAPGASRAVGGAGAGASGSLSLRKRQSPRVGGLWRQEKVCCSGECPSGREKRPFPAARESMPQGDGLLLRRVTSPGGQRPSCGTNRSFDPGIE